MDENTEGFSVVLSEASSNASIGDGTGAGTITDDDPEPEVATISDFTVLTEGNADTVDATITVTLSAPSGKTIRVPWATAPGTATEDVDYVKAENQFLVFDPGQTSKDIIVKVKGDTLFEQEETFSVVITDPENARPGPDSRGEIRIRDDDFSPTPTVSNPSVSEGNPGSGGDLVFDVTLSSPRPETRFNYRTLVGTATGSDFVEVGGSQIVFPANTTTTPTTLQVTIGVKRDLVDENNESFTLQLLNPTTQAVVATATGTIVNDDNNSKLSVSDATADEPSSGTATMTFTVTLSQASERNVTVNWATADGTATAGVDYTAGSGVLSFTPGQTSKTVAVAVTGDTTNEPNETLRLLLSNPTGVPPANLTDAQGDGTIVDKNAPPSLSISDTNAREGEGANFTVTLAGTTIACGHGPLQHRRRHRPVERRLRRAHGQPDLRAGREVEDDHRDGVGRHPLRGRRGLRRRPRRPRQRRGHEGSRRSNDRSQRPDDADADTAGGHPAARRALPRPSSCRACSSGRR